MSALLSTAEAARLLGVTDSRVRLLIRQGRLPATRLGARAWVIPAESIERFERRKAGRTPAR